MTRKMHRRHILSASLVVLPSLAVAGDLFFHGRKVCNRCCLPDYDYGRKAFHQPVSGTSFAAVSNVPAEETASITTSSPDLKMFQIRPRDLISDHCRVSRVVMSISRSGHWFINLDAQQSPALVTPEQRPQFEPYVRNRFRVDVKPVLIGGSLLMPLEAQVGSPELPLTKPKEFWIEKNELRHISLKGHSSRLEQHFDSIEQVNVYFSYR